MIRLNGELAQPMPNTATIKVHPRTAWSGLRVMMMQSIGLGFATGDVRLEGNVAHFDNDGVEDQVSLKPAQLELLASILVIDRELQ